MKFYYKGGENTAKSYVDWAIKRFGLYYKVNYGTNLQNIEINEVVADKLIKALYETVS